MLFTEGVLFLDCSFRLNFSALKPAAPAPPSCGGTGCQERAFFFSENQHLVCCFFFFLAPGVGLVSLQDKQQKWCFFFFF